MWSVRGVVGQGVVGNACVAEEGYEDGSGRGGQQWLENSAWVCPGHRCTEPA